MKKETWSSIGEGNGMHGTIGKQIRRERVLKGEQVLE